MAAVIRIEDYRDFSRQALAARLRRLAADRAASVERMRQGETETLAELAARASGQPAHL